MAVMHMLQRAFLCSCPHLYAPLLCAFSLWIKHTSVKQGIAVGVSILAILAFMAILAIPARTFPPKGPAHG